MNSLAACQPLSLRSLVHVVSLAAGFLSPRCLAEGVVIYCTCCSSCFPLSVSNIPIRVAAKRRAILRWGTMLYYRPSDGPQKY